jgi:hypothetical protein
MNHKKTFIPAMIILVLSLIALVIARSGSARDRQPISPIADTATVQKRNRNERINTRNLSLQPEAFRMGRRLGARFDARKREASVLRGTLVIGSAQRNVQILRTQTDNGERVEISLAGAPGLFAWDAADGAVSATGRAIGPDRKLIERLVLDSPDQLVLAQLRGASYSTVARQARPAEVGGADDYRGPTWDLVRVTELESEDQNRSRSPWRLYYINTATGLIDKIVSQEGEETITAELSDWVNQGGESFPARITWKLNDNKLMELVLTNVVYQPLP